MTSPDASTSAAAATRTTHSAPGGDGGYKTFTAADGAYVFATYEAPRLVMPVYKGKWKFIGGTGRYAGIKGHGTLHRPFGD